jgi:molybdate transport system substrate-binding protein
MRRFLFTVLTVASIAILPARAQVPLVAAAADLEFALAEVAGNYRHATGLDVKLSFGSSGNFMQQIENGAPFAIFLSADEAYVARLAARGLTRGGGVLYATGRIALFVPRGSPLAADPTLRDLQRAIADGRLRKFAIANPEHAPYGRAAREALTHAGLWDAIAPRLVLGENAAQATRFAAGGDAQGGIVPLALALAPGVAKLGTSVVLPEALHAPLRQRMVLLARAGESAVAFFAYLQSPAARAVLARYGFAVPGTP